MATIEKPAEEINDQDLFIGANGIRPNTVTVITPEQALLLQGEPDAKPTRALQEAFEARRQNLLKSRGME